MTTKASPSQGIQLKRGDGATPEVFTLIGEVISISGLAVKSNNIDVTSLDSTAKEFIPGLDDGGELQIEVNFVASDTQQQGLRADQQNRVKRNFQLVLNDPGAGGNPTKFAFASLITSSGPLGIGVDKQVTCSFTLKITGDITPTYAS